MITNYTIKNIPVMDLIDKTANTAFMLYDLFKDILISDEISPDQNVYSIAIQDNTRIVTLKYNIGIEKFDYLVANPNFTMPLDDIGSIIILSPNGYSITTRALLSFFSDVLERVAETFSMQDVREILINTPNTAGFFWGVNTILTHAKDLHDKQELLSNSPNNITEEVEKIKQEIEKYEKIAQDQTPHEYDSLLATIDALDVEGKHIEALMMNLRTNLTKLLHHHLITKETLTTLDASISVIKGKNSELQNVKEEMMAAHQQNLESNDLMAQKLCDKAILCINKQNDQLRKLKESITKNAHQPQSANSSALVATPAEQEDRKISGNDRYQEEDEPTPLVETITEQEDRKISGNDRYQEEDEPTPLVETITEQAQTELSGSITEMEMPS